MSKQAECSEERTFITSHWFLKKVKSYKKLHINFIRDENCLGYLVIKMLQLCQTSNPDKNYQILFHIL